MDGRPAGLRRRRPRRLHAAPSRPCSSSIPTTSPRAATSPTSRRFSARARPPARSRRPSKPPRPSRRTPRSGRRASTRTRSPRSATVSSTRRSGTIYAPSKPTRSTGRRAGTSRSCASSSPRRWRSWSKAGRTAFREEDLQSALDLWRRALLVDPRNERVIAYIGRAERQLQNLERLRANPTSRERGALSGQRAHAAGWEPLALAACAVEPRPRSRAAAGSTRPGAGASRPSRQEPARRFPRPRACVRRAASCGRYRCTGSRCSPATSAGYRDRTRGGARGAVRADRCRARPRDDRASSTPEPSRVAQRGSAPRSARSSPTARPPSTACARSRLPASSPRPPRRSCPRPPRRCRSRRRGCAPTATSRARCR